jgi:hypothetical protein
MRQPLWLISGSMTTFVFQELGMDSTEPWHKGQDYLKLAGKYPTALGYVAEALFHVFSGEIEEAVGDAGRAIALDPTTLKRTSLWHGR